MIFILFLLCSICLFGSDQERATPLSIIIPHDSCEYPGSPDSDEEDSLCESALSSVYPETRDHLRPYLKQIMKRERHSPDSGPQDYRSTMRRAASQREDMDYRDAIRIKQFLLDASHMAIQDREKELARREHCLQIKDRQLNRKFSKKITAIITTVASSLTAAATAIIVHYSK